jgi:Fe-S-cluster containining protein
MKAQKALKIIYKQFDQQVKQAIRHTERAENMKLQCRRGCNYCCNLLVNICLSEALPMYLALGKDKVQELFPKLVADAKELADPTMTLDKWTRRWGPCHLLTETGDCSVYDVRPFPCRSHVAFSPPEKCNDPDGMSWMLAAAHPLIAHYTQGLWHGGAPAAMAPLQYQLLVWHYIETHSDTSDVLLERLRGTPLIDLPLSVQCWKHLMEEPDDRVQAIPVVPIWEWFDEKGN